MIGNLDSIPRWRFGLVLASALLVAARIAAAQEHLPGTQPLTADGDLAAKMVEGIDQFLLQMTQDSVAKRARHWKRDTSSHEAYNKSVEPNRERLKKIIGVVDQRVPFESPEVIQYLGEKGPPPLPADWPIEATVVRWPVFPGVDGEGWLYSPKGKTLGDVILLSEDHEFSPNDLANHGFRVLAPILMDRDDRLSVIPAARATNQPHREFIYRQAYEMGRHIIGYEVQKVLAAVDWLAAERKQRAVRKEPTSRIGVLGHGEGGLLALYAAAIDPRIDTTCISGYFGPRESLWSEPIYRNVWSLLDEFGDAEIASLIAPRPLIIEEARVPLVFGPPTPREGRSGAAPGELSSPTLAEVKSEYERLRQLTAGLQPAQQVSVVATGPTGDPGSRCLETFLPAMSSEAKPLTEEYLHLTVEARPIEPQFQQLVDFTQKLMRESPERRAEFWKNADTSSVEAWQKSCEFYRKYFYDEVIGRVDLPLLPPNPRSRKVYDEPKYTGYEVQLDVFPGVFAYGILLLPKDIQPGEKRPVVVCQHGLEGRPTDVADPKIENPSYHQYACRLAERGFITYAPQNPYIGQDKFRTLQRKANPLKLSLFSFIVPQHQQTTDWLASLPMVDPQRIAFYGLSYGGKTAMRVPPLVDNYCLSICSADFNEWIWKNVSSTAKYSYVATGEYEMFEFDLGNTFNYAEMAGLIAPRPFMVERGHHDGVAPDEWVAYEYAKVRRLYAALKIPERTEIEFFDGPHTINGKGTFDFLERQLNWASPPNRK
ncbi:MAG: dienelactone hydrolase family protein [Planctomycetaceae bacterium]|nr:dienelactone hydrolase family protein [Planctomycetaceae bacterium]